MLKFGERPESTISTIEEVEALVKRARGGDYNVIFYLVCGLGKVSFINKVNVRPESKIDEVDLSLDDDGSHLCKRLCGVYEYHTDGNRTKDVKVWLGTYHIGPDNDNNHHYAFCKREDAEAYLEFCKTDLESIADAEEHFRRCDEMDRETDRHVDRYFDERYYEEH